MYAEIHAEKAQEHSRGKTTYVNSNHIQIDVGRDQPKHIGQPAWYLRVRASSSEEITSGIAGGEWREIDRSLEVHLTPEDLSTLLKFLVDNRLVVFTTDVRVVDSLSI